MFTIGSIARTIPQTAADRGREAVVAICVASWTRRRCRGRELPTPKPTPPRRASDRMRYRHRPPSRTFAMPSERLLRPLSNLSSRATPDRTVRPIPHRSHSLHAHGERDDVPLDSGGPDGIPCTTCRDRRAQRRRYPIALEARPAPGRAHQHSPAHRAPTSVPPARPSQQLGQTHPPARWRRASLDLVGSLQTITPRSPHRRRLASRVDAAVRHRRWLPSIDRNVGSRSYFTSGGLSLVTFRARAPPRHRRRPHDSFPPHRVPAVLKRPRLAPPDCRSAAGQPQHQRFRAPRCRAPPGPAASQRSIAVACHRSRERRDEPQRASSQSSRSLTMLAPRRRRPGCRYRWPPARPARGVQSARLAQDFAVNLRQRC